MERRYRSGYLLLCVKRKENIVDRGVKGQELGSYCGAGHASAAHGTGGRICADVHDPDGVDMSSGPMLEKIESL